MSGSFRRESFLPVLFVLTYAEVRDILLLIRKGFLPNRPVRTKRSILNIR